MVIISPPLVFTLHWSHGHSCEHVTVCLQRINKIAFIPIYFRNFGRNLKLSLFIGGLGNSAIFGVTYWKTSDFRILPRYAYC